MPLNRNRVIDSGLVGPYTRGYRNYIYATKQWTPWSYNTYADNGYKQPVSVMTDEVAIPFHESNSVLSPIGMIPVFRPCYHEKWDWNWASSSGGLSEWPGTMLTEVSYTNPARSWTAESGIDPTVALEWPATPSFNLVMADFADTLAGRTSPSVMSLVTFGELASIRELRSTLGGWFADLGKFLTRRDKRRTLAELDDIIKLDLGWKFGIKPFFTDLVNYLDVVKHTQESLNQQYLLTQGLVKRVTVARKNRLANDRYSDSQITRSGISSTRTITAYVSAKFRDTDAGAFFAMLGSLGISRPVESLYNLVPFSFVLDWFVDSNLQARELDNKVQKILGLDNACGVGKVYSICTSTKLKEKRNFNLKFQPGTQFGLNYLRFGSAEHSIYHRQLLDPQMSSTMSAELQSRGFSTWHAVTSLELLRALRM